MTDAHFLNVLYFPFSDRTPIYITNTNAVLFDGTGTTAGTVPQNGASATSSQDVVVAKYTDNGSTGSYVWTNRTELQQLQVKAVGPGIASTCDAAVLK